jgi:hypothetical protein
MNALLLTLLAWSYNDGEPRPSWSFRDGEPAFAARALPASLAGRAPAPSTLAPPAVVAAPRAPAPRSTPGATPRAAAVSPAARPPAPAYWYTAPAPRYFCATPRPAFYGFGGSTCGPGGCR